MEEVKRLIHQSTSGDQLMKALNNHVKIVMYPDIYKYKTIEDLLKPYKCVIMLYKTSFNYGHWCCIYEYNNVIHFFDSYGYMPDSQFKFIPKRFLKSNYKGWKHINKLLKKSKNYEIRYNHHKLQGTKNGAETCGRWVVGRLLCYKMDEDEFYNIFKGEKDKDLMICYYTENII